jgi:hypothetical protein
MAATSRQPDWEELLMTCISNSRSRVEFWVRLIQSTGVQRMAETGVYRGDFAAEVWQRCGCLTAY